jgi:hypothetical protein
VSRIRSARFWIRSHASPAERLLTLIFFLANRIPDAVLVFEKSGAVVPMAIGNTRKPHMRSRVSLVATNRFLLCLRRYPTSSRLCSGDSHGYRTKERAAPSRDDFTSMVKLEDRLFQDHACMARVQTKRCIAARAVTIFESCRTCLMPPPPDG